MGDGFTFLGQPVGTSTGTVAAGNDSRIGTHVDAITAGGLLVPPRRFITNPSVATAGSGVLHLTHFTAVRTETITTVTVYTGATAAAATPTLIRYGIWSVASNNVITLLNSTVNDTTLLAATHTVYPKVLSSSFSMVAGTLYAVGFLIVSATTMPTLYGIQHAATVNYGALAALNPPSSGQLASQTDLLSGITPIGSTTSFLFRLS